MKEGPPNQITAERTRQIPQNPIINQPTAANESNQAIRIKTSSRDSLFSHLHSNHSKDFLWDSHQHYPFHQYHNRFNDNDDYFADSSQVHVLRLRRSLSGSFEPTSKYYERQQSSLREEPYRQESIGQLEIGQQDRINEVGNGDQDQSLFNLQSYSNYSQHNIHNQSQQHTKQLHCRGLLVKNVTKNIGKLLFKFVWKNRINLSKAIKADRETWDKFMLMIRGSKKHNNVTREFLMARFHGQGEQFRLMRVVAHHFFRKHCLAAIFGSKIKAKRVHFQRIRKFDQALSNVRALDYLV